MIIRDYTITDAEVIYQKAIIHGAWWFLAFLVVCVLVYFIAHRITQDRMNARYHDLQLARIKESEDIGKTGFWMAKASQTSEIIKLRRALASAEEELAEKDRHIASLEETMTKLNFGDVAERIRQQMQQQSD